MGMLLTAGNVHIKADASSSNRPPSDINATNLTIPENSAIGTIIGEFNATDPDGGGNFTFYYQFLSFRAI